MNGGPRLRSIYGRMIYKRLNIYGGVVINCGGASVDIGAASAAGVGPVKAG